MIRIESYSRNILDRSKSSPGCPMVSFGVQGQVGSTVSWKEFVVRVSGPRKSSKP